MVFRGRAGLEYQLCYFLGWQAILPLYSPVFLVVKSDFNNFHSESCSVVSNSLRPHELYSPWTSPGQNTGVGSLSLLRGNLLTPGIKPRSPALQVDSLPAEPQGWLNNTGVSSLSLLQGNFPTQELNLGHLHCRRILYQLSYQRSPNSYHTN